MRNAFEDYSEQDSISVQRIGVRQFMLLEDVTSFSVTQMVRPAPLPKMLAVLSNHEIIYIFSDEFRQKNTTIPGQTILMDQCRMKIDLRSVYKLFLLLIKLKYSANAQCFFLLLQNGQIAVLSDQLYLLDVVKFQCYDPANSLKYCLDFQYVQRQDRVISKVKRGFFVFLFTDTIEWHEVEIDTNHKLSKFKPSYKLTVTQINKSVLQNRIKHPNFLEVLNTRISRYGKKQTGPKYYYLTCNCTSSIFVHFVDKISMKIEEKIVIQVNGSISSAQVSSSDQRLFLGMANGQIKVFSLKTDSLGKLLFTINVCQNLLQKIFWNSSNRTILSYSKDNTLSLIKVDSMMVQQKCKTGNFTSASFISQRTFLGIGHKSSSIYNTEEDSHLKYKKSLIMCQLTLQYDKLFDFNASINRTSSFGDRTIYQFSDNSLLFVQHKYKEKQVVKVGTYMPPNCINILSVSKNIYTQLEEYWFLTDRSQVYKYCISNKQVKVSGVIELKKFTDKIELEHKFKITYLIFSHSIVPIEFNSQMTQVSYPPNPISHSQMQPVIMGTSAGDLLIVSLKKINFIVFRLKPFDTPVKYIYQINSYFQPEQAKAILVFGTAQRGVMVEVGPKKQPVQLHRLQIKENKLKMLNKNWIAIMSGSNFNLLYFKVHINSSQSQCLKQQHYNPSLKGEPELLACSTSSHDSQTFIVTGYSLGQIILWKISSNFQKQSNLTLLPLMMIQNTKEEPIQFVYLNSYSICFNWGQCFIQKSIQKNYPQFQSETNVKNNIKIPKGQLLTQQKPIKFMYDRSSSQLQQNPYSMMKICQNDLYAPQIPQKKKKIRSVSVGRLLGKNTELQSMFHFPDSQTYRTLIKKKKVVH